MNAPIQTLPLALEELPPALKRFCDPNGPAPGRMMAAKGLVPVRGHDQIIMLAHLAHDEAREVKDPALASLKARPRNVLEPACSAALPFQVLDFLASTFTNEALLGLLIANHATGSHTVERMARTASEMLAERIAVNEARLLQAPLIIEALYKNKNTRMSTADRLIDLAARNGLELSGIPAFKEHVEALQGQLIPEPSEEPLPQDAAFNDTLEMDADGEVIARDKVTGEEEVTKQFKPLSMQIADMSKAEKIRLAMVGSKGARMLLVRDNNRQVAYAAVSSPQMSTAEAAEVAKSKEVSEEILRYVGGKKDWIKSGEVKHNLVFNPKTPVGISMRFISHLRLDELRALARSRNVAAQIRSMANQWINRREKK